MYQTTPCPAVAPKSEISTRFKFSQRVKASTAAFVPQMWLTLRTRDVGGISLAMYSLFTLGIALWLAYGIALGAWPVIVPNVITLVLALAILVIKLRVERRGRRR